MLAMPSNLFAKQVRHQDWEVEEGSAEEIAPKLKDSKAQALVFVSHSEEDNVRTQAIFEALKRAYALIDTLMETKQDDRWKALLEALMPDVPFSPNKLIEAGMFAQAIKGILESEDFAKAADIAEIAHFSRSNPSSQPNRWKKAGLIFAVPYKGTDLYPIYALEFKDGARPLPIMEKLLHVFADKDDWQKAFWFGSLNSYLQNKMPKDLLRSKPQEVLRAAEIEAAGVQHG
jgi:hypothetical protein